jgi:CO/xanthine dehydrogenase FAD-binding subunit
MRPFEYVQPASLDDALKALGRRWQDAKLLAGGQDLLTELKEGIIAPDRLVNLKAIKGLRYLRFSERDGLRLGAFDDPDGD